MFSIGNIVCVTRHPTHTGGCRSSGLLLSGLSILFKNINELEFVNFLNTLKCYFSRAWWLMPLVSALGGQRQAELFI